MSEVTTMALTVAIEAPLAAALGAAFARERRGRAAVAAALVASVGTAVTHPIVWEAALALYPRVGVAAGVAIVEVGAIAVEAVGYRALYGWRRAVATSLVVNAASAGIGAALTW